MTKVTGFPKGTVLVCFLLLNPMSSSAVGPNSQHLQNSLVSESRGEEACGKGVNMAGIKKRHTVTLSHIPGIKQKI